MNIKIKKLHKDAVIPFYASEGAAGMDLTATEIEVVDEKDHGYISYKTGLAMEIPVGYMGLLFPRGSVSKTGLIMANCVGVVDADYRGDIEARFKYVAGSKKYDAGDRVAQIIILPFPTIEFEEVEELTQTERGEGGHGSTGS